MGANQSEIRRNIGAAPPLFSLMDDEFVVLANDMIVVLNPRL